MKHSFLLIFLMLTQSLRAQHTITGKVVDAETGEALLGAHVYLVENWRKGAITDLEGNFSFDLTGEDLLDSLIISYVGFQEKVVSLDAATIIEMSAVQVEGKTVVVTAQPLIAEEFKFQKISKLDIYTNPAAQADPILAVNSLPSATTTDESANISLRGSSPIETGIFMNNVPIYDAVRYSQLNGIGTFSIFNTAIIKGVTVFPGNPPVEFGNVTSGVVSLETDDRILEGNSNSATISLANIGFSRQQKIGETQSLKVFSNWQPSDAIKGVNAEALDDIESFSSNDLGVYWYGANKAVSWRVLSYTNLEGFEFNFNHPSFNGIFDQSKLRSFLVSSVSKPLTSGELTFNNGLSVSKGNYGYSNVAFEVNSQDAFFGLNYLLSKSKYSLKAGLSYDRRFSSVTGNFHEVGYALAENHPTVNLNEELTLNTLESFAYFKFFASDQLAIGVGTRKNLPTDSLNYLSGQLNLSYIKGKWSFIGGLGRYHKVGLFENSGTPFFSKSDQVSLDIKYQASVYQLTLSVFDKASEINGGAYTARGAELFADYNLSAKVSASGSFTYLNAASVNLDNYQYDLAYFIRGNIAYRPGGSWTIESTLIARQGTTYNPVSSVNYDPLLDAYDPTFSDFDLRLNPYLNIGLSVSKVFLISQDFNIIVFASTNNILNRENIRSYTYNRDYSVREPSLFAQRTAYFGAVLNF